MGLLPACGGGGGVCVCVCVCVCVFVEVDDGILLCVFVCAYWSESVLLCACLSVFVCEALCVSFLRNPSHTRVHNAAQTETGCCTALSVLSHLIDSVTFFIFPFVARLLLWFVFNFLGPKLNQVSDVCLYCRFSYSYTQRYIEIQRHSQKTCPMKCFY